MHRNKDWARPSFLSRHRINFLKFLYLSKKLGHLRNYLSLGNV